MTAIAMLLLPRLTPLDLTGPYEVLARMPGAMIAVDDAMRNPAVLDFVR